MANVQEAIKAGVHGVHVTVNGLGERAGNAPITSVIALIHDHMGLSTNVDESRLYDVSKVVKPTRAFGSQTTNPSLATMFSRKWRVCMPTVIIKNLYYNNLMPERFGRFREYALGKNAGRSNITKNLEALGIQLDDEATRKVTARIIELGDKKR